MTPGLAAIIDALEAERLAPVPRASHVVGVDVDDLALLLDHASAAPAAMSADTAIAYQRLTAAVRGHATHSAARRAA